MLRARGMLSAALASCAALALPVGAAAQTRLIDGSPLNIWVSDDGQLQVRYDGQTEGQLFPPSAETPNAGFNLAVDVGRSTQTVYGFSGPGDQDFRPRSQSLLSGDGVSQPFRQTTSYEAFAALNPDDPIESPVEPVRVTQTVTYRNGDRHFDVAYDVQRISTTQSTVPTRVRASVSADLWVDGSDSGSGFLETGPPQAVGGRNVSTGATAAIVEVDSGSNAWGAFEANRFGTIFSLLGDPDSGGLTNRVLSDVVDNGVGAQFPDATLCAACSDPPASIFYRSRWRFEPGQAADPPPAQTPPPAPPPPPPSTQPQQEEPLFPAGTPTGRTIADLPRPRTGQAINVGRVSGEVLVKFPSEQGARASQAGSKAERQFVPLDGSAQIPVGSTINTNKGVLRLQSASNGTGSRTQTATFFLGTFELRQARSRRPVTEMVLKGGSFRRSCGSTNAGTSSSTADQTAADARARRRSGRRVRRGKRVRRLWGRGRGRYRTRGRYSAATVRGTKWVVEERCNGTFTRVARRPRNSSVVVRDFVSRRNISLRSGKTYFAPKGRIRDARISLSPRRTTPGGTTTVTGRGWGARRLVTLRVRADGDGSLARVVRVRTSRRGSFRKRVRLARDAGIGRYTVQACRSRCSVESTASLSLRARLP